MKSKNVVNRGSHTESNTAVLLTPESQRRNCH